MVTAIPMLATEDKRELLHLLNPVRTSAQLSDEELEAEIVRNLRRSLGLSRNIDLAQGFRRRMIELAPEFALAGPFDLRSDTSIAQELVDAVFAQAADLADLVDELEPSEKAREEFADFETYLKTKNSEHRREWLHRAAVAASISARGEADPQAAVEAEEGFSSHSATARTLVKSLTMSAAGGATGAQVTSNLLGATALATAAAPLGVVAAGAFLCAQRRRRRDINADASGDAAGAADRGERTRSRLSPMVQAVVTVCAFLLARSGHEA